ncbi:methyltransferase family protein [Bacillus cereus]|uniref:methyltransferase family protein n=1 Tax=Bacillus cereus TaxID=1396 RepID=UPI00065B5BC5|nr:methyltransferase dimerization domain-containing protein [Bacillus cereus]KMQ32166.1 hypothetical protein TU58_01380 [Bacillus cereus]
MLSNALLGYKQTEALFAASDLGIIDLLIQEKKLDVGSLVKHFNINRERLTVLLRMLQSLSIIEMDGETVGVTKEGQVFGTSVFASQLKMEREIQRHFARADIILQSLKMDVDYNAKDVPIEFLRSYLNFMYRQVEPIVTMLSYWIPKSGKLAELGRGFGTLIQPHCKKNSLLSGHVYLDHSLRSWHDIFWEGDTNTCKDLNFEIRNCTEKEVIYKGDFELVILYNTIHYWSRVDAVNILRQAKALLQPKGKIIIVDLFLDRLNQGRFQALSSVAIDWLTHGGIHLLDTKETVEFLQKENFSVTKREWAMLPWTFLEVTNATE